MSAPSSPPGGPAPSRLIPIAMMAAGMGVAAHVIGKATRDALFVAAFPIEALPYAFLGTGVASGGVIALYTRITARRPPRETAPWLALSVAASLVLAWLMVRNRSLVGTAVLYAWLTITGTLVVSSFWALLSEIIDVRAARRSIGLLTFASSVGALLGAAATHAFLLFASPPKLLLPLAGMNCVLAGLLWRMARNADAAPAAASDARNKGGLWQGMRSIAGDNYLRDVTILVAATAIAGTLADFLLKSAAAETLKDEAALAQFFASFHGVVGGVTLGVQLLLARPLLKHKGLAASLAVLPGFLFAAALAFVALPSMIAAIALRGGENTVRNSFHRAAYELLFVPVRAETKRATKAILDALLERVADGIGALVLIGLIAVGAGAAGTQRASVVLVGALALVAGYFVLRVRRGYVASLTTKLQDHHDQVGELSLAVQSDQTAFLTMQRTLGGDGGARLRERLQSSSAGRTLLGVVTGDKAISAASESAGSTLRARVDEPDSRLRLVDDLQSRDVTTLKHALEEWDGTDRRALPFVIELLGNDDVHVAAAKALERCVDRHVGALCDELRDDDRPLRIRNRIARLLGQASSSTAAIGLCEALASERFELRYRATRALRRLAAIGVPIAPDHVWAAVRRDMQRALPLWEAQRRIDDGLDDADVSLRDKVADRGAYRLRHVFNLLALVLDPEPVDLAYRSLDAEDAHARGVALEYLEHVLPQDVRRGLWPYIGDAGADAPPMSTRAVDEILAELKASPPGRRDSA